MFSLTPGDLRALKASMPPPTEPCATEGCGYKTYEGAELCEHCQAAEEQDHRISEHLANLGERVQTAEEAIVGALRELGRLVADDVFYIELAEGTDGVDLKASLKDAARHVRAARRIADHHYREAVEPGDTAQAVNDAVAAKVAAFVSDLDRIADSYTTEGGETLMKTAFLAEAAQLADRRYGAAPDPWPAKQGGTDMPETGE